MHPVIFRLGPFTLRWYGVMIATAFILGLFLAKKELRRKGIKEELIYDFAIFAFLGGLIISRIYYLLFYDPGIFFKSPWNILAFWEGGLAIHGALLGGLLISIWFTRKHKLNFWGFADALAPSLILGQTIGRIGCFLNGDAHGYPTDLPWGLVYSPESPAGQMFPGQPLHPTQLYESILNLFIFLTIWRLRKRPWPQGFLFLTYVSLYSLVRIIVEFYRADKLYLGNNFPIAQVLGITVIITSLILMRFLKKSKKKT